MPGNTNTNITVNRELILTTIVQVKEEIEQNKRLLKRKEELLIIEHELEKLVEDLKVTLNRCTAISKDVRANLEDKRRYALEKFNSAIKEASEIVPDSDLAGVSLKIQDGRASIVNPESQSINAREGSACQSVMGQMMRHMLLTQMPGAIPIVILDETFFTFSDNTSRNMQTYLEEMAKDVLIIGVEQKATLFQGIENIREFEFIKEGTETTIREDG